jgi:large subunit ribosomal protein L28
MARRCELTGKGVLAGNNVSHSNIKSRRRFLPNVRHANLDSEVLGRSIRFRVSAAALRSVEHNNGLDNFLIKQKDDQLSDNARRVKREIKKALAAKAAESASA